MKNLFHTIISALSLIVVLIYAQDSTSSEQEALLSEILQSKSYTSQSGDTLHQLAEGFYQDSELWPIIYASNRRLLRSSNPDLEIECCIEMIIPSPVTCREIMPHNCLSKLMTKFSSNNNEFISTSGRALVLEETVAVSTAMKNYNDIMRTYYDLAKRTAGATPRSITVEIINDTPLHFGSPTPFLRNGHLTQTFYEINSTQRAMFSSMSDIDSTLNHWSGTMGMLSIPIKGDPNPLIIMWAIPQDRKLYENSINLYYGYGELLNDELLDKIFLNKLTWKTLSANNWATFLIKRNLFADIFLTSLNASSATIRLYVDSKPLQSGIYWIGLQDDTFKNQLRWETLTSAQRELPLYLKKPSATNLQSWFIIHVREDYYSIISAGPNEALTLPESLSPCNQVIYEDLFIGSDRQLWKIAPNSDGPGYEIKPYLDLSMTIRVDAAAADSSIYLCKKADTEAALRIFSLIPQIEDGLYYIYPLHVTKLDQVMEISKGEVSENARLQINSNSTEPYQLWNVTHYANDLFYFINKGTQLALTVPEEIDFRSVVKQTAIVSEPTNYQLWRVVKSSYNGFDPFNGYRIKPYTNDAFTLDVDYSQEDNETLIWLWKDNGPANQAFAFKKL